MLEPKFDAASVSWALAKLQKLNRSKWYDVRVTDFDIDLTRKLLCALIYWFALDSTMTMVRMVNGHWSHSFSSEWKTIEDRRNANQRLCSTQTLFVWKKSRIRSSKSLLRFSYLMKSSNGNMSPKEHFNFGALTHTKFITQIVSFIISNVNVTFSIWRKFWTLQSFDRKFYEILFFAFSAEQFYRFTFMLLWERLTKYFTGMCLLFNFSQCQWGFIFKQR